MTTGDEHDQEHGVVDVDPYDPGTGELPVFRWRQAGPGYATRRQLRAMGLRPGGQEPAARIECRGGRRFAWLYQVDLALPKRTPTLAQEAALDRAMAARTTCPRCLRRYVYCLPLRTLGSCLLRTTGASHGQVTGRSALWGRGR
ncbi:RRQRL motif-containing zinc-binding protein, partial [Streptomyces sp. NPDC006283]|uniref:RRQRL motif-containing zinc-binding protein n=1 Tax=Streptomyces sp. NPDC006283 TaxID=3156741 RepID=UPI0033AE4268